MFLDDKLIARQYPHPDFDWSTPVFPLGKDKIQEARTWIWDIARAHKVNAEVRKHVSAFFVFCPLL